MDVTTTFRTPIATPTVIVGDLFFGQGGDQLNGGRRGTEDCQPVLITVFWSTLLVLSLTIYLGGQLITTHITCMCTCELHVCMYVIKHVD
jgi:hypothetical protein